MLITDHEGLIGGLRVRHAQTDEINEIGQCDKTTPVVNGAQRQRNTFLQPLHHGQEVGLHAGPIDQRRANDHHLHPRFGRDVPQTLLSFPFADAIGVLGIDQVICAKNLPMLCEFAVDFDGT